VNVSYVDEDDFLEGGILQTLRQAIINGIMQISKNIKKITYEENPCTCP
jgi:hypothetical protein